MSDWSISDKNIVEDGGRGSDSFFFQASMDGGCRSTTATRRSVAEAITAMEEEEEMPLLSTPQANPKGVLIYYLSWLPEDCVLLYNGIQRQLISTCLMFIACTFSKRI